MAGERPKTSVDLIEEATYLLRSAPAGALAAYYIGTLPFALAFLFFWADMSGSASAPQHAAPAALGVAIAFVWMAAWQAVFSQGLRTVLTGAAPGSLRRAALAQASLQPTKLIVIPIAALVTIPLAVVFAFYQNLMAIAYEDGQSVRRSMASALRQAKLWPGQNWAAIGIAAMLACVVFANVAVLLLLIPQLLKSLLGIQTALARNAAVMLNTTFLAIAATLTYAIVDPLIKAIYVLRCYYGESLATGEDLKAQIKIIAAAVEAVLVLMLASGPLLHAQAPGPTAPTGTGATVEQIDRSIDEVLKRPEFTWRLPHRPEAAPKKNWFAQAIDSFLDSVDRWSDQFFRWLHEKFRPNPTAPGDKQGLPALRMWFYVLLGAAVAVLAVLLFRAFKRPPRTTAQAEAVTAAVPDLASDETQADQLPAEEWLRTARDCVARNNLRLAVRALFLANLAYLANHSLVSIDRAKSNRDYERELRRRARSKPEILPPFRETMGVFERAWYGMHDVSSDHVTRIEENLASMRARVEQ